MRDLKNFSIKDWLKLLPVSYAFKLARNNYWLDRFKKRKPAGLDAFLRDTASLTDRNIALIVAFEQPWALEWLLKMASCNVADTTFLVFDNSRSLQARREIEQVCKRQQVPYLGLPANRTRHVNRSHGNAMTWIYHNVVRAIRPRMFAFVDHDMIPVQQVNFEERLARQPVYGYRRPSKIDFSWNLWAGYCCYDYRQVAGLELNFLYDFSRGLDTGGCNWDCLYRDLDYQQMRFAESRIVSVKDPVTGFDHKVQLVDDNWLHIGGISYNNNFESKQQFCKNLADSFIAGKSWVQIYDGAGGEKQAVSDLTEI